MALAAKYFATQMEQRGKPAAPEMVHTAEEAPKAFRVQENPPVKDDPIQSK